MSYSGGSNLSNVKSFVILVSRGVFFFDNARKKNEVKSCPHSRSRPRIWVTASPFRRQSFDLSQVPLSPRNIHICKAWAGKVKCNRFFGLQIESSEKLRVIRSRLPPSLICSLLATGCAL